MNLVLDIGNSYIKIALFEKSELIQKFQFSDNFEKNILDTLSNYEIKYSIISNVGKIENTIIELLNNTTNLLFLSNQLKFPFKNLYNSKNTLGQDRLALVSAAAFKFPKDNVLIIDAGSCITYDFKNSKKIQKNARRFINSRHHPFATIFFSSTQYDEQILVSYGHYWWDQHYLCC